MRALRDQHRHHAIGQIPQHAPAVPAARPCMPVKCPVSSLEIAHAHHAVRSTGLLSINFRWCAPSHAVRQVPQQAAAMPAARPCMRVKCPCQHQKKVVQVTLGSSSGQLT